MSCSLTVSRLPSLSLGKKLSIESLDTVQNEENENERQSKSDIVKEPLSSLLSISHQKKWRKENENELDRSKLAVS